ncbi:MAG: 3-hydroxyacyl-CoA dehydrogenase family protein [Deltaproteobacteria bacterium]|nr:3-hydroxyacyl-CoA dehydrogenase family protein [Deltaproteobacteria bacterium]
MKLEDVKCVGILGAGIMGGGIAQAAILHGDKVIVRDLSDEINDKAKEAIINGRFGIKSGVERGKHTQEEMDKAVSLLNFTTKVEDLADCDLIIEAIGGGDTGQMEDKPLKLRVFKELDEVVKKEAVFASNTSFFTIADLAEATNRKENFVGMHWFSPANIMKLVEVIYPAEASAESVDLVEGIAQKWEKITVRVKDVPGDTGFIGNRVWFAAIREAMKIVQEGVATAEDVNTAMMHGFRWPAGPLPTGGPGAKSGWK